MRLKLYLASQKKNDEENFDIMIADFDNLPELAFSHDENIILNWKN